MMYGLQATGYLAERASAAKILAHAQSPSPIIGSFHLKGMGI
jgi:hypothetical protein